MPRTSRRSGLRACLTFSLFRLLLLFFSSFDLFFLFLSLVPSSTSTSSSFHGDSSARNALILLYMLFLVLRSLSLSVAVLFWLLLCVWLSAVQTITQHRAIDHFFSSSSTRLLFYWNKKGNEKKEREASKLSGRLLNDGRGTCWNGDHNRALRVWWLYANHHQRLSNWIVRQIVCYVYSITLRQHYSRHYTRSSKAKWWIVW